MTPMSHVDWVLHNHFWTIILNQTIVICIRVCTFCFFDHLAQEWKEKEKILETVKVFLAYFCEILRNKHT